MKVFTQLVHTLVIVAGLAFASAAHAGMIGKDVTFNLLHPGKTGQVYGSGTATIQNGTTIGPIYDQLSATFSNNTIRFGGIACCEWIPGVFYHVTGMDLNISNVSWNAAGSTYSPFANDRITFDANNFWVDVGNLPLSVDQYFTLDVQFADESTVPEPSSLALLGVAALGFASARRRRTVRA